jgi:hypothetical protein
MCLFDQLNFVTDTICVSDKPNMRFRIENSREISIAGPSLSRSIPVAHLASVSSLQSE